MHQVHRPLHSTLYSSNSIIVFCLLHFLHLLLVTWYIAQLSSSSSFVFLSFFSFLFCFCWDVRWLLFLFLLLTRMDILSLCVAAVPIFLATSLGLIFMEGRIRKIKKGPIIQPHPTLVIFDILSTYIGVCVAGSRTPQVSTTTTTTPQIQKTRDTWRILSYCLLVRVQHQRKRCQLHNTWTEDHSTSNRREWEGDATEYVFLSLWLPSGFVLGIKVDAMVILFNSTALSTCASDCGPNGRCLNSTCICSPGWTGSRCHLVTTSCDQRCSQHGQCFNGTCVCSRGWNGRYCTLGKSSFLHLTIWIWIF